MSDLRTRIAAIQRAHVFCIVECSCGYDIDSIHPSSPDWKTDAEADWADHVADAVIRELELTKQYLVDGIISDGEPRPWELPCETRYATEWERFDDR